MKLNTLKHCKELLGSNVEIELKGNEDDEKLFSLSEIVFDEVERIHHLLSFHCEASELSSINRQALTITDDPNNTAKRLTMQVSPDLEKVLSLALELNKFTRGLFDVTIAPSLILSKQLPNHLALDIPDRKSALHFGNSSHISCKNGFVTIDKPLCIDLGGIAKGYGIDCAMNKVPKDIYCRINIDGDILINKWRSESVVIKYSKRCSALKAVKMQNKSLATINNLSKHAKSSIVIPFTGKLFALKGCLAVFASSAMLSDALTKAMVLSTNLQKRQMAKYYNAQAITINRLGFVKLFY